MSSQEKGLRSEHEGLCCNMTEEESKKQVRSSKGKNKKRKVGLRQ